MDVGPLLEGPVHPRDQVELVFVFGERLERWGQILERFDTWGRSLLAQ